MPTSFVYAKQYPTGTERQFDHPYVANGLSELPAGGVSVRTNWKSVSTSYAGGSLPRAAGNFTVPVRRATAVLLVVLKGKDSISLRYLDNQLTPLRVEVSG
jgi:hypothetical protein